MEGEGGHEYLGELADRNRWQRQRRCGRASEANAGRARIRRINLCDSKQDALCRRQERGWRIRETDTRIGHGRARGGGYSGRLPFLDDEGAGQGCVSNRRRDVVASLPATEGCGQRKEAGGISEMVADRWRKNGEGSPICASAGERPAARSETDRRDPDVM